MTKNKYKKQSVTGYQKKTQQLTGRRESALNRPSNFWYSLKLV